MIARVKAWREERQFLRDVLREVNALRRDRGMKPLRRNPKGTTEHAFDCPIAKATGAGVDMGRIDFEDGGGLPTPLVLAEFVRRFDKGELPRFEA